MKVGSIKDVKLETVLYWPFMFAWIIIAVFIIWADISDDVVWQTPMVRVVWLTWVTYYSIRTFRLIARKRKKEGRFGVFDKIIIAIMVTGSVGILWSWGEVLIQLLRRAL